MVDGPAGVTIAHARELVEVESSPAGDSVTIPRPNMEARNATEQTSDHETATQILVQVNRYTGI